MKKQFSSLLIVVIIGVILLIFFGSSMFYTLQPGDRAIIFRQFTTGLDKENIFEPGFHVIAPWNDLHIYNVKEQKSEETMDVLDRSGLSVNIDISVRFNPIYEKIGFLHEVFGKNYINQLVIPEVRSSVRQVAGRYTAEEIYSTKRSLVEKAIIEETTIILEKNFIQMRAMLIRSIGLPNEIKNAIESKLKQEQEALAYKFRLDKEKSEAERKKIEAEGISNYNLIISQSLTTNILKQRGIEATIELAKSNNTKVVVVGAGKDGLPLILGNN
ncbi:MAG: prohibitin family protein [Bacteroidetes bacterium]|jgi:regulator of protease activity HflC (stomatin/prohibitin superfamily)|nr:prohibitin family protein [Bacteroidota bacterium]MBT6685994.1 prohibitin family protein [Bacteroidota bacterium]MBT7143776.1 prohibitin family protein [Bacteroidota bacterium]MBT7490875.1 prohibitin family protein [Bacteroidota bacterium]